MLHVNKHTWTTFTKVSLKKRPVVFHVFIERLWLSWSDLLAAQSTLHVVIDCMVSRGIVYVGLLHCKMQFFRCTNQRLMFLQRQTAADMTCSKNNTSHNRMLIWNIDVSLNLTFLSGRLNRNSRSKRPGLLSAGSIESSLFVAPMTTISPRLSKPSIKASRVDTIELDRTRAGKDCNAFSVKPRIVFSFNVCEK